MQFETDCILNWHTFIDHVKSTSSSIAKDLTVMYQQTFFNTMLVRDLKSLPELISVTTKQKYTNSKTYLLDNKSLENAE